MTKQEEIREGVRDLVVDLRNQAIVLHKIDVEPYLDAIFRLLHSQGVVIKVDEMPPPVVLKKVLSLSEIALLYENDQKYIKAGYVATEPLIKEKK